MAAVIVTVAGTGRAGGLLIGDSGLAVYEPISGQCVAKHPQQLNVLSAQCLDPSRVLLGTANGTLQVVFVEGLETMWSTHAHDGPVWGCAMSEVTNGELYSGGEDGVIRVWQPFGEHASVPTQHLRRELTGGHDGAVMDLRASALGKIVSAGVDRRLCVWDPQSGRCMIKSQAGHTGLICSFQIHGATGNAVSVSADNTLRTYDLTSGENLKTTAAHKGTASCVCVFPDGRLATGGVDGIVRVWKLDKNGFECLHALSGHVGTVIAVSAMPNHRPGPLMGVDYSLLVSTGSDGQVILWDPYPGKGTFVSSFKLRD